MLVLVSQPLPLRHLHAKLRALKPLRQQLPSVAPRTAATSWQAVRLGGLGRERSRDLLKLFPKRGGSFEQHRWDVFPSFPLLQLSPPDSAKCACPTLTCLTFFLLSCLVSICHKFCGAAACAECLRLGHQECQHQGSRKQGGSGQG